MTDQEYETVMAAAEAVHKHKMARVGGTHTVMAPPAVEVTNVVKTPEVHVKNNLPAAKNIVTVTTKELAEPLVKGMEVIVTKAYDQMASKFDELIRILTKLCDRPHPPAVARPKSMRLETDKDGIRRAIPEYE